MSHTAFLKNLLSASVAVIGMVSSVQAASFSGQGTWQTTLQARDLDNDGTTDAFFDTELNITWLRNVIGQMTWNQAITWADDLNFGGYTDWRLPTLTDTGTPGCNFATSGTDCGHNVQIATSEMAHLFFSTLGNKGIYDTNGNPQLGWGLTNTGDFQNMQPAGYWLALENASYTDTAWSFYTDIGYQAVDWKNDQFFALAVRPGDVTAVPEPSEWLMMLTGLGVIGLARRRQVNAAAI